MRFANRLFSSIEQSLENMPPIALEAWKERWLTGKERRDHQEWR